MREAATLAKSVDPASRAASAALAVSEAAAYRVCEFIVESAISLPELTPVERESPDCRFEVLPAGGHGFTGEVRWFHQWISPDKATWLKLGDCSEDYLLRFLDQADFLISRDGKHIRCCPLPGTPESTIRHLFLDQVVPLVLSRREPLVLHASGILTREGVIAFVGKSGQGKSTLAACFGQEGFRLISDDYLLLRKMDLGSPQDSGSRFPAIPGSGCGLKPAMEYSASPRKPPKSPTTPTSGGSATLPWYRSPTGHPPSSTCTS